MNQPVFSSERLVQRRQQLEGRLRAAVARIGDGEVESRVSEVLVSGEALPVMQLLLDSDPRVVVAAHECAMLRFSFVVALTAQALGFDSDQRDDLVQRTFVDLPIVVARSQANGVMISNAEGWLRRRALLIGRTMLREERGSPLRDPVTGLHLLDREGRKQWTRGTRIPLEGLGQHAAPSDDEPLDALDSQLAQALLTEALHALESEKMVWGQVLRLHYIEGYSLEEIGIKLGRSHGTIRNDAQKARVRLAGILRERFPRLVVSQTDRSK